MHVGSVGATFWYPPHREAPRLGQTVALMERITVKPEQCGGRPCVRGMRIRVADVLDLLANGMSAAQVVAELPDLESDDVTACLQFAGTS